MDILLTIIAVIVIFSALVLIHEYGHFIAARRAGIKVLEFGIGFPPRLFARRKGETLYSINAIPFGGFVKLFGEDATSPDVLKNKRSFANKTPWIRTKVVVAGVVMNFLLAIFLLTVGFIFGIEPLLVTEQDLFAHIAAGNVKNEPGAFIADISKQAKTFGLNTGDHLIAINDKPITTANQLAVFQKGGAEKDIDIAIQEAGQNGAVTALHIPLTGKNHYYGIDLKPLTEFPRLAILEVKPGSASSRAGLKPHDVILQMNLQEIYTPADFETVISQSGSITFTVLRGTQTLGIPVALPDTKRVVIADIFDSSVAAAAGFQKGDIIISINSQVLTAPEQVQEMLKKNPQKEMIYRIRRKGDDVTIKTKTDERNLLGVFLSAVTSFRNTELSLYRTTILTSITEIKKVRYGPLTAFKQAVSESVRLTGLTVKAFGNTITSLVSKFKVPNEIGGPVQIAYYTHAFVKEGFFALLRFAALLSISLAVINIMPIPALDGGRLLFIVIEAIFRKRVSARLESVVHGIGFFLLLALIGLVTYSDIVKLF